MQELYGGIDVGSEYHHIFIIDEEDKTVYDSKIRHTGSELHKAVEEFKRIQQRLGVSVSFAMEGMNGYSRPLDGMLISGGFKVYNIDNLKLSQFRNAFGAESKADRRDAQMLARLLKLKNHLGTEKDKIYLPIEKPDAVNAKLKALSRHQQGLISEKVRIQNRLRKRLLEICPEILQIGELDSKLMLRFLIKYPDVRQYKRITTKGLRKLEMVGQKRAAEIKEVLSKAELVEDLAEIYREIIASNVRRLLALIEEIQLLDRQLEELGQQSKEVQRMRTIPAVGTKLGSRLVGEIGDIRRFKNEKKLAAYLGVACVENSSGKKNGTKAIKKANKIGKATMIAIASNMVVKDAESKRYYEKKKAEGKKHNDALRCLARQLVKVIFKMLTEDRDFIVKNELKEELKKAA